MKAIHFAAKYRPFSHEPTSVLVPRSSVRATVFPARVEFHEMAGSSPVECGSVDLPVKGVVRGFTVQLDLEKQRVAVWGEGLKYEIACSEGVIRFQDLEIHPQRVREPGRMTRLFLGCTKQQNLARMRERFSLEEILPIITLLGQQTPETAEIDTVEDLETLLRLHFEGLFSPTLADHKYQGVRLPPFQGGDSPLALPGQVTRRALALFFRPEGERLFFLPEAKPHFPAGRVIDYLWEGGEVDFVWSKKRLQRALLMVRSSGEYGVHVPGARSCRIGRRRVSLEERVALEGNTLYQLDQFQ